MSMYDYMCDFVERHDFAHMLATDSERTPNAPQTVDADPLPEGAVGICACPHCDLGVYPGEGALCDLCIQPWECENGCSCSCICHCHDEGSERLKYNAPSRVRSEHIARRYRILQQWNEQQQAKKDKQAAHDAVDREFDDDIDKLTMAICAAKENRDKYETGRRYDSTVDTHAAALRAVKSQRAPEDQGGALWEEEAQIERLIQTLQERPPRKAAREAILRHNTAKRLREAELWAANVIGANVRSHLRRVHRSCAGTVSPQQTTAASTAIGKVLMAMAGVAAKCARALVG